MNVLYFYVLLRIIHSKNYHHDYIQVKPSIPRKISVSFSVSDKYYPGCPVDKGFISL